MTGVVSDRAASGAAGKFTGWRILWLAILTAALSGPGQTIGVAVFVDHFIVDLNLSRSSVSSAYFVGTLAGALAMPMIGRAIDAVGVRRAMTAIGAGFGVALVAMSGVQGFVSLVLGFTLIRMLGQGSLSLVSTVAVTHWFERRRGFALGLMMTVVGGLMALAPIALNGAITWLGWRSAWLVAGVVIWVTVVPIGWFGMIDRPSDIGQRPDGDAVVPAAIRSARVRDDLTRWQAMRTLRFWVLLTAVATTSLLATALNFHQIRILGEAGLSAAEAAAMFLPQVITASLSALAFGVLSDRWPGRHLILAAMMLMAGSLALGSSITPGWQVVGYALTLGAAGGSMRSVSATLLPRWFGTAHIGSIHGAATFVAVAASAFGPVALSVARDATGAFGSAILAFVVMPAVAAAGAVVAGRRSEP